MKEAMYARYSEYCPEELKSALPALLQNFSQGGETMREGRNTVKRFRVDGVDIVAKQFRQQFFFQRWIQAFRRNKADKAYENALQLIVRDIDTPYPLAYVKDDYPYYVYLFRESTSLLRSLDTEPLPDLADALAEFFVDLHKKGILHKDLNSTNIRVQRDADGKYRFSLIDINRMAFIDSQPDKDTCLRNLLVFVDYCPFYDMAIERYLKKMGWYSPSLLSSVSERKRKRDESYAKKKRFLHKITGRK